MGTTSSPNPEPTNIPKPISKWWYIGIIGCLFIPPLGFLISLVLLWMMPDKLHSTTIKQRLKDWRKYWFRSGATGLVFVLIFLGVFMSIRMENSVPATFEILSSQEHQGDALDYTVQISAAGHTTVVINETTIESEDNTTYESTIPFTKESLDINIVVYNEATRRTEKSFTVTRDPITEPEIIVDELMEIADAQEVYTLSFVSKDATSLTVNGESISSNASGKYTISVPLENPTTEVNLTAQNSFDLTSEKVVTIIRPQTRKEKILSLFHDDGNHKFLTIMVKLSMFDRDSFQHVGSSYEDNGDTLTVTMFYTGRNLYGERVQQKVVALVDLEGNVLEILEES